MTMKKVKTLKGFVIALDTRAGYPMYPVYTKEEWGMGIFRCYEWEACTMKEAEDFINSDGTWKE
jgi:hypothetical protein